MTSPLIIKRKINILTFLAVQKSFDQYGMVVFIAILYFSVNRSSFKSRGAMSHDCQPKDFGRKSGDRFSQQPAVKQILRVI